MKYYQLTDDINFPHRWYLGEIIDAEDNWQFILNGKVDESSLKIPFHIRVYQDGLSTDYTENGAFNIPIVSERVKLQLGGIENLQFIPVVIEGKRTDLGYFIMVVGIKLDCVDEKLSEFGKFAVNDPVRPDLAGQYSWFTKLIIDPQRVNGENIFRIGRTSSYLVVSEKVKDAFEDIGVTGAKFIEV